MKPVRKTRHALMIFGAGAVTAYFLDPENGPARRERLKEQFDSLSSRASGGSDGGSGSSDRPTAVANPSVSAETFPHQHAENASGGAIGAEPGPIDLATGEPLANTPASGG
jgi:hypothetical protein